MRGPLAVRVNDGTTDRHVTKHVTGYRHRYTAPGGYESASMRINLPRTALPDFGPADKVYVYNATTGATVFEGYSQNPGTSDGPAGQGFDLTLLGNVILASDTSEPAIYVDRDLTNWDTYTGPFAALSANVSVTTDPTDADPEPTSPNGLLLHIQRGQPVGTGTFAAAGYDKLRKTGQTLGGLYTVLKSGKNDVGFENVLNYGGPIFGSGSVDVGAPGAILAGEWIYNAIAGTPNPAVPPQWPDLMSLLLTRIGGATTVADDQTWTWFRELTVIARRLYRDGSVVPYTDMGSAQTVRADQVVEDVLGRLMPFIDTNASTVEATTAAIDQLTYLDGATAAGILDDLAQYEADMTWELLHSTPRGVVFRYRRWLSEARFEVSVSDGYSAPGGDDDLANRIAVYWTDEKGTQQTTVVTADVPELGGDPAAPGFSGRVKDADPVTIPEGRGSLVNATLLGQQELAAKSAATKASRVTIRRPLLDRVTGRRVWPWEFPAGWPVRIRETGQVLRCTEVEYNDDDSAVTLTLGVPTLSTEQRVARLWKTVA